MNNLKEKGYKSITVFSYRRLWKEQTDASVDNYVFSSNFKAGKFKTTLKHMNNKWKEYVREGLGIDIDFIR